MKRRPGLVEVEQTATCSRCGSDSVAWVQSKKGKWYLVEAYGVSYDGGKTHAGVMADRFDFHSKHCTPREENR